MEVQSAIEATPKGGRKARLLSLADIDRRTSAYKETRRIIDEMIESDLGGSDALSTGEKQLVQRAAVLGAILTDIESRWIDGCPVDAAAYCTIVNAQRRVLETIGLRRRAKLIPTQTLAEIAEEIEAEKAARAKDCASDEAA